MIAFDDGPLETTGPILDILKEHGFGATFFVVGHRIAGNEELLCRMRDEGHAIGNHAWSHLPLDEMVPEQILKEIADTHHAIIGATGFTPRRFRPPFVRFPAAVFSMSGYEEIEREPSFGDYDMSAAEIIAESAKRDVLWLHDGHWPTVEALPTILAARA